MKNDTRKYVSIVRTDTGTASNGVTTMTTTRLYDNLNRLTAVTNANVNQGAGS